MQNVINRVIVLTGTKKLNNALVRYIKHVYKFPAERIIALTFNNQHILFDVIGQFREDDLWIIEVFNPEDVQNPVGWRTGKKLPGKVFFVSLIFPPDETIKNEYFIYFPSDNFKEKLDATIKRERPSSDKFEEIENKWPRLKYKPSHHHSHHHR